MRRHLFLTVVLGLVLVAAGCGGGGPTTPTGDTAGPGDPTAEPAPTTGGGGGGGSANGDACALLTAAEVEEATGFTNVVAQPVADADTDALSACGYVSEGAFSPAITAILDPENTNTDPTGYLALPGSEELPVSGGRAILVPASGNIVFIIKGGTVASLLIVPTEGEVKDAAAAVVQKVVDRL